MTAPIKLPPDPTEIISRSEAMARGLTRYFTGKPCKHWHITERKIGGQCLGCAEIYRVANIERIRERNRKASLRAYYADHDKNKLAKKEGERKRRAANPVIQANKQRRAEMKIAREAARAQGLKHFQGPPCPQGHTTRYVSKIHHCVECNKKYARAPRFVLRECVICRQTFHPLKNDKTKTCSPKCRSDWRLAFARVLYHRDLERYRAYARKNAMNGPQNPTGELQWLRKNQAQLRSVKRYLRNRHREQSESSPPEM